MLGRIFFIPFLVDQTKLDSIQKSHTKKIIQTIERIWKKGMVLSQDALSFLDSSFGITTAQEVFRAAPPETEETVKTDSEEILVNYDEEMDEILPATPSVSIIRPKKILVADDNELTLQLMRDVLEYENYHVITAKDGLEAIKLGMREVPDLIITDLMMPKMNGLVMTTRLKARLNTKFIPIII